MRIKQGLKDGGQIVKNFNMRTQIHELNLTFMSNLILTLEVSIMLRLRFTYLNRLGAHTLTFES